MGFPIWGMTYSQTRLVYKSKNLTGTQYIDLSKGLALLNQKNCSQFKDDVPLNFHGSIRQSDASTSIQAVKNLWTVRNAAVKTGAAWRRTLRSAGIRRKSQLNTYAREMRVAFDDIHSSTYGGWLTTKTNVDLIPEDVPASYDSGVYTEDGDEIKVYAFADIGTAVGEVNFDDAKSVRAFTQTRAAVPASGSTDVADKYINVLGGDDSAYLNMVYQYTDSRINDANVEDTDMDETPSVDNDLVMMLAPGEEIADDVLDNVNDEGRWRPYSLATGQTACDVIVAGANVAGQETDFIAPMGLLAWTPGSENDYLVIDVHGIHEM